MTRADFKSILGTAALALVLGILYNAFAAKPLDLIRKPPAGNAVSDSALFGMGGTGATGGPAGGAQPAAAPADSVGPSNTKVIAPLHEKALAGAAKGGAAAAPSEPFRIITIDQLKRLLAARRGILIDARGAGEFARGHIRGARNIPAESANDHFGEIGELPRDTMMLVYCSNPECPYGRMLTGYLRDIGFRNLLLYDEGWDGWEAAHLPADTGRAR